MSQENTENIEKDQITEENVSENQEITTPELSVEEQLQEELSNEKDKFLRRAVEEEFVLFLEHDSVNECCTLQMTEKGVRLKETFRFEELFT